MWGQAKIALIFLKIKINEEKYFYYRKGIQFSDIKPLMNGEVKIELSKTAIKKIDACRKYLDNKIEKSETPIYGITTGFGSLCNTSINKNDLSKLQKNLVLSHACGLGAEVKPEIVRLMLAFKIHALSLGHSGVQVDTVQLLCDMYNNDIIPIVYEQGSLGASGDLSPLAHMCLPLIGCGEVYYKNKKMSSTKAFKDCGLKTINLKSKEGLALLNGTQFMSAHGAYSLLLSKDLFEWSNHIFALSLDAYNGRLDPFHHNIQAIRPHEGQKEVAKRVNDILKGSNIAASKNTGSRPILFRCVPQVHGATWDAIQYVSSVFIREINSVTDNPTVFPEDDLIISAGNFHGQPLAITFDFLGIAMSELANISERRIYQLINGKNNLPSYLVATPGLNSGFMIPQYTAASIVSQNKQLASPASVDSIESSQGQEDHVSMGANAATKTIRILENVEKF